MLNKVNQLPHTSVITEQDVGNEVKNKEGFVKVLGTQYQSAPPGTLSDAKPVKIGPAPRPSWDIYFLNIVFMVALRSQDWSTRHGCVLVNSDTNTIIGCGYNGLISGFPADAIDFGDRAVKNAHMVHSEVNAALNASVVLKDYRVKAYITGRPCVRCLSYLAQAGVRELVLADRRGWTNPDPVEEADFNRIVEVMNIQIKRVPLAEIPAYKVFKEIVGE